MEMPQGSWRLLKWWVCCRFLWCQDDTLPPVMPQMEDGWTWGFWKMSFFSKKIGNCFPIEQGDLLRKNRELGKTCQQQKQHPFESNEQWPIDPGCLLYVRDDIILPNYISCIIGHCKDLYETISIHLGKLRWQCKRDHLNMYFLLKKGTVYCHLSPPEGLIKCHNSFETLARIIPWPLGGWVPRTCCSG